MYVYLYIYIYIYIYIYEYIYIHIHTYMTASGGFRGYHVRHQVTRQVGGADVGHH